MLKWHHWNTRRRWFDSTGALYVFTGWSLLGENVKHRFTQEWYDPILVAERNRALKNSMIIDNM